MAGLVPDTHRGRGQRADGTAVFVAALCHGGTGGVLYGGGCGRGVLLLLPPAVALAAAREQRSERVPEVLQMIGVQ